MSQEWYKDPELQRQQREWYAKLAADGFNDIEQIDWATGDPKPLLRGMSQGDLARGLYKYSSEEYYSAARAHVHRIKDRRTAHVWELHSEGYSVARIHAVLGERYGLTKGRIDRIVKEQRQAMMEHAQQDIQEDFDARADEE